MNELHPFFIAIAMGLAGGSHCLAMCGGIGSALGIIAKRPALIFSYNAGRILSYMVAGTLVGSLGGLMQNHLPYSHTVLPIVSGLLLIFTGLYVANIWRGVTYLEKGGYLLWKKIQPLSQHFLPVKHKYQAFVLGGLWGWLPCGLVYSALLWSSTLSTGFTTGLLMLGFGLGTLPFLLAIGFAGQQVKKILQHKIIKGLLALCLIAFGCWTLFSPFFVVEHGAHMHHH